MVNINKEVWKPVNVGGLEEVYEVSNTGKVRSIERMVSFGKNMRTSPSKILRANDNGHGYKYVDMTNGSLKVREYIHRLVAKTFIANDDYGLEVNHIDGDKSNNNASNLEWVSADQNKEHAYLNSLMNGKATDISYTQANMIIDLVKTGNYTNGDICEAFKISNSALTKLKKSDSEIKKKMEYIKNKRKSRGDLCRVYDKSSGKTYEFINAKDAADHFGFYRGYFSELITKKDGENAKFKAKYITNNN